MSRILFTDVNILDGSGAPPFRGCVLVDGERIAQVSREPALAAPHARVVAGRGATLMPGLIESHSHLTFLDMARSVDLGFVPPEEHMLLTVRNAKRLLDAGFTSCLSAASAKPRLDIVLRNAVDAGDFPGPRTLAASPEMTVTAGLGDVRLHHLYRQNFAEVLDGPAEFRRFAREMVREGVDTLKINVSGDGGTTASPSRATVMLEAEVDAVCDVARAHGKRVAAHVRNGPSVQMALRNGVDILYHGNLIDDEACAALEAQKDRIFFAPTIGHTYTSLYEAGPWGITTEMGQARGLDQELERGIANMKALKQRGVRVLPGGDYGFAWNPNGANARDLEHFVNLLGFSPMEAIVAATRLGGQLMLRPDDLGQVKPGYVADLLLVDGDPLADIAILRDRDRLAGIMKSGSFHKTPAR
ncbi:MAG: amidohydrolase family protein [Betaproteobacteria bacterium]